MASPFAFPVFFDFPAADEEQRRRIEKYFNIRRKSGGGDCGAVTKFSDKVCSVAFKDRDAQQRVLQKHQHELEISGVSVVLTVREGPEPTSQAVSPELHLNTPQQSSTSSPPSTPPSTPPSSAGEYEKHDVYLLRYLSESPEARRELEKELDSVGCSAQLHPEEGRVVVRCSGGDRNWKSEVEKVFDGYQCHFEPNPRKVKDLLQSCMSAQTSDGVKVYSEDMMAVVVGRRSEVKARLKSLEEAHAKRGSLLKEKQTSTRRLGEAKLRLLWKEMESSLGQECPGVKVTQGEAGQVVLEGSVEEILKAGVRVSDLESSVVERRVSDKSLQFLAFLRKTYGGPGVLADFLGVGGKVEVELRDTELRLFTMTPDKLDEVEKKLQDSFKEVKISLPNNSSVPPDLQEILMSKIKEMNRAPPRAQVLFGPQSTVSLMGHTKEVEELSEIVTQFILDQSSIESKVTLPFPDLAQVLPELLQMHNLNYPGITFHHLTSAAQPMIVLEGPASKVTEFRDRLGPFVDSLVQTRVTIDLPGAVRYFKSPSGRENILSVAQSQKCSLQLQEKPEASQQVLVSGASLTGGGTVVSSYNLLLGLQVVVCQGDITKVDADALVNAANEDLDHRGGVAAALSKAGGPEVQRESRALVKDQGKVPTGDVVVTTGGTLHCKNLLHAVGPVGGKSDGKERKLLEKTIRATLDLAELMNFESIAMPCISSGAFGVPISLCSEVIVTAVQEFGSQGGRSLSRIILIDNRGEVVRALKEACDRILQGSSAGNPAGDVDLQGGVPAQDLAGGASAAVPGVGVHMEIIHGTIETQQVDSLVSPMAAHDPLSSRVGNILLKMVGPQLTRMFHHEANGATRPGDTVLVEGLPKLQSKGVFFLHLLPWDNNRDGPSAQELRRGIKKILASCRIRGFTSVALPVLGTGPALRFPHSVASRVIMEAISDFQKNQISRSSFLVRVVVHPNDKESGRAFQSAQETLRIRGFTNHANPDQVPFYCHVSTAPTEVTAMLGGVKLQIVNGDIVQEITDAIVNTTDFQKHRGVSKAILDAAGPNVQSQLAQIGVPAKLMCTTGPGTLACREIIHASFKCDTQVIQKNCKMILKQCESKGYHSVAFPAVNTGVAGMDSAKACKAMLDGMAAAIIDLKPTCLSLMRIVVLQRPVFQAFRSELESRFGKIADRRPSLKELAKQKFKKLQDKFSKSTTSAAPQGRNLLSVKPPPAVISVISRGSDTVSTVKRTLEEILQKQLVERRVEVHSFSRLDAMELEAVQAKIKASNISMEYRDDRSGSGKELYVLRGLNEDVLSVTELIHRAVQEALRQDIRDKEEAMTALNVQWSIQEESEMWHELSLHNNFVLEEAHMKKRATVEMTTQDGITVTVNLVAGEATNPLTGFKYRVKRIESETAFELPQNWEPMHEDVFKKVELLPNSREYQEVAQGFEKTANYNIRRIERVQNVYLWQAYTVCRQRILNKNGEAELGEKFLYHGTSAESCKCIERDRFDRSYAGRNAARYGRGVYFAVNAQYSCGGFAPADAFGVKRVYVARVLTGRYTQGAGNMKAPPPRGSDPTDCYDSVVDKVQSPTMFVVFHDDQAYPEYLITFT